MKKLYYLFALVLITLASCENHKTTEHTADVYLYNQLDKTVKIDIFNGDMFERTSKIPMDKIEEAVKTQNVVLDGLYSWDEYIYLKEKFKELKPSFFISPRRPPGWGWLPAHRTDGGVCHPRHSGVSYLMTRTYCLPIRYRYLHSWGSPP